MIQPEKITLELKVIELSFPIHFTSLHWSPSMIEVCNFG